jgi:hypothetical protein
MRKRKMTVVLCSLFLSGSQIHALNMISAETSPSDTNSITMNASSGEIEAQPDSIVIAPDSLTEASEMPADTTSLLPSHYLFTQRWLWSENGLMRKNGKYPLNLESRNKEMDLRATMNKWHRIAGYTALAGMIGSGISGQMTANGNKNAKSVHQAFTGITNIAYFGSLAFALFSPPPMQNRESGFTSVNIHRSLAIVHVASMLATDILSGMLQDNPKLIPYHRAAAITAFTSLLAATIVINF